MQTFLTMFWYTILAWLLGICYGFVLISSAAGQNGEVNLFKPGESLLYKVHSTVLLNEKGDDSSKNVGFYIAGDLSVDSLWGLDNDRILRIKLNSPKLNIRSRKAPSPDGFIQHSSKLDEFPVEPFYVVWRSGKIDRLLIPKEDPSSLVNLKKGIASLFQFQILDVETNETDSSGHCQVQYRSLEANKFQKIKTQCLSEDLPYLPMRDPVLGVLTASSRIVNYELDSLKDFLRKVHSKESHQMYLGAVGSWGTSVEADQILEYVGGDKVDQLEGDSLDLVLSKIENRGIFSHHESLLTEREILSAYDEEEEPKIFTNAIGEMRTHLLEKHVGSLVSAKAFIRLVDVARRSNKEDVAKALGAKKNQKILPQIYDILGYVQTPDVHQTVLKKLHFDKEDHLDLSERYLWALSMAPHPNPEIVADLLKRYQQKSDNFPEKVKETLVMTLASMVHRLQESPAVHKVKLNVEEAILNGLDYAKEEQRYVFLRALKNLKSPSTIPKLIEIIRKGTSKESVLAFKALRSFNVELWDSDVIKTARRTFLQLDRKQDSSSRTLALDILLESRPISLGILQDLLDYLKSNDSSFEVKQYLFQRLQMIGEEDPQFKDLVLGLIRKDPGLNNYAVLSPRGLSTALKRNFLSGQSLNGSLVTVQEMFGGIVKRGTVDVVLSKHGAHKEMMSLGIFASGLGSFVSSSSDSDSTENEVTTAGIELTILDTQIRPFVFFTGQGELMGHIWSGTASTKTTAFQSLVLLRDHEEYLRLGPGIIVRQTFRSSASYDLSGKIEISIWSRTADALVENSAALVSMASSVIDTFFIRSQVEAVFSLDPKLSLKSDIDAGSNVRLCMRVSTPDSTFRHNIFKIERIPGSKHKLRIAKYKKVFAPGITFALNRKNNEMCTAMYS